tara:strand:- start:916 stop:1773 length:858 start_codon:yes stop_codon:yes gene_type:complete
MTGYGKAELNLENTNFTIEIKSLNAKQIDVNVKLSSVYRDKEIELRKLLSEKLKRGKIELSIWRASSESYVKYNLNNELIKAYFSQINQIKNDLGINVNEIMPSLLKMPEVLVKGEVKADENEWAAITKAVDTAINNLLEFRLDEGRKLEADIKNRIHKLFTSLTELEPLAKSRIEKVKKNLSYKFAELESKYVDKNRFEQELIYYLEKQDITEEQVRLSTHLDYFLETIKTDAPNGKKLAFICQEIGREINTIGSKSSDAEMQKIVVQMKDELEKIKEQLLNIL